MNNKELKDIVGRHYMFLNGENGGKRANLRYADLRGAELYGSNLRGAILRGANLSGADLRGANLSSADFRDANLRGAILRDANLSGADFKDADLRGAEFYGVNLSGANLSGADLRGARIKCPIVCPEEGSFIGFKKCKDDLIVKLQITKDSLRCSATSRKCRCSKAKVISITKIDGTNAGIEKIASKYDENFIYEIGKTVKVSDFDANRWNECSTGIHFFITRQEAVDY